MSPLPYLRICDVLIGLFLKLYIANYTEIFIDY